MPNWCNNEIIIRHDDKQKLIEIKEATETTGICEFLIPPPDTPAYRDEYVNSQKELEDDPTWWRNWNCRNWGMKWRIPAVNETEWSATQCSEVTSTGDIPERHELYIWCDTPWNPPFGILEHLHKNGFDVDASFMENGMDFWGWWKDGDIFEEGRMSDYMLDKFGNTYSEWAALPDGAEGKGAKLEKSWTGGDGRVHEYTEYEVEWEFDSFRSRIKAIDEGIVSPEAWDRCALGEIRGG